MTQPSSVFRERSSPSHALNLHGYTSHHYEHLDNDRDNEETAILVKDFVFSASFNIHTPLQVTRAHLNLLSLLLNAATPTYHKQHQCLLSLSSLSSLVYVVVIATL